MNIEQLYNGLEQSANMLQKELDITFLEALVETGENLFQADILQQLDDLTERRLQRIYDDVLLKQMTNEEIRKAMQLAILKGMKEATQPNHEMTADSVCLFISYVVEKFMQQKNDFTLLDPAIGTGNLVTSILNQTNKQMRVIGIDVDETLLKLAYVNANLQKHAIELVRQDSLAKTLLDPVDLVVCDLPVGYYPNEENAKEYQLKSKEGHSLTHHLFIEKSIVQVKEAGFLVLLVPNFLFESKELNTYINEHAVIHGLLQLPHSLFKHKKYGKSILLLQKKGDNVTRPKQALLVELPSFSNQQAMHGMIKRLDHWLSNEVTKGDGKA